MNNKGKGCRAYNLDISIAIVKDIIDWKVGHIEIYNSF
jgi:hypothetical protein